MGFYTQKTNTINGQNVWLYLAETPIGNIFIVQHEENTLEVVTDAMIMSDLERAEKKFNAVTKRLL